MFPWTSSWDVLCCGDAVSALGYLSATVFGYSFYRLLFPSGFWEVGQGTRFKGEVPGVQVTRPGVRNPDYFKPHSKSATWCLRDPFSPPVLLQPFTGSPDIFSLKMNSLELSLSSLLHPSGRPFKAVGRSRLVPKQDLLQLCDWWGDEKLLRRLGWVEEWGWGGRAVGGWRFRKPKLGLKNRPVGMESWVQVRDLCFVWWWETASCF